MIKRELRKRPFAILPDPEAKRDEIKVHERALLTPVTFQNWTEVVHQSESSLLVSLFESAISAIPAPDYVIFPLVVQFVGRQIIAKNIAAVCGEICMTADLWHCLLLSKTEKSSFNAWEQSTARFLHSVPPIDEGGYESGERLLDAMTDPGMVRHFTTRRFAHFALTIPYVRVGLLTAETELLLLRCTPYSCGPSVMVSSMSESDCQFGSWEDALSLDGMMPLQQFCFLAIDSIDTFVKRVSVNMFLESVFAEMLYIASTAHQDCGVVCPDSSGVEPEVIRCNVLWGKIMKRIRRIGSSRFKVDIHQLSQMIERHFLPLRFISGKVNIDVIDKVARQVLRYALVHHVLGDSFSNDVIGRESIMWAIKTVELHYRHSAMIRKMLAVKTLTLSDAGIRLVGC